jgi:AsmA protein
MSRILFFLVALIALALAVLIFAPGVLPIAAYKDRIEAAASSAIGREVTFSDDLTFRILPRTAFHVTDLTIANADGFHGDYLAKVAEADIDVNLIKLITSDVVVIDQFVLIEPDITLIRKANGAVNWNLANAENNTESTADQPASSGNSRDIRLGDVRIAGGTARFSDLGADKTYVAEDIDVRIVLTSLEEPLEVKGTMTFQGEPSTIDIVLSNLAEVMRNEPSNLKLDIKIGETTAGADLTVETKGALRYRGPVQLNAPDLPAFAALLGTELADAPGFDKLSFSGDVDGGDSALRLSDAQIGFDDINAQGVMTLNWTGARPKANGVLSTDMLDLRAYLPPPAENAEGFPEWSSAKMDFTGLRNIDADFDISTDAILLNDLKIGESRLKLTVINGRMTADIPELSMYGGQGSGRLVVNARGAKPTFSGNFDMGAVQAEPMTMDLFKNDNLLGLGSFTFDFNATGDSQAAIMSSLDGSGGFDLADGLIKGVNLGKLARAAAQLSEGFNPAALQSIVATARGPSETTDFSEFLSNFTITNGLVTAPAISLNGQYLTMTGKGSVNLPAQTIDLRLSPRATASLDGGQTSRSFSAPVRVGGTFSNPTIGLDAEILTRLLAGSVLQQVLGGDGNGDQAATPEDTARGLIEGILGGSRDDDSNKDDTNGQQGADGKQSAAEPTIEETIANEALNALFGSNSQPADESNNTDKDE